MALEREKILARIGLNIPESKVYLGLLKLKEAKTGELCEETKVASSNIYPILSSLIVKGLVSYRVQNNVKVFMPATPEVLSELFKEKEKKIEDERNEFLKLVQELKESKPKEEPFSKYKYYEGITGVKSLWLEITNYLEKLDKKSIVKIYTGKTEAYMPLMPFYEEFHKVRSKLGIRYKVIYPLEETKLAEKRRKQLSEVKFLKLENEAEFCIIGNKLILQYITRKVPRAFLIDDEVFAKSYEQVFDQLWKLAK